MSLAEPTTDPETVDTMHGLTSWRPSFHGRGGSLFGIFVTSFLLMLITLGVYVFWAKVRIRRFLFSQTALEGDRFAFHGHGTELLLGMLRALVIFGVPIAALRMVPSLVGAGPWVTLTGAALAWILAAIFMPVARVAARRYRLTRTSWRGVRFGFHGRVAPFMRIFFRGWALTLLTLGVYYPIYLARSHRFMVQHASFGTARFDFDGDGKPLVLEFVYTLLLTLPTFGLVWFWFIARKRRYLWAHTSIRGVRFRSTITGGRLLGLVAGNVAMTLGTLGLAWPWAIVRSARVNAGTLMIEGTVDLTGVHQTRAAVSATGEGLLGLLNLDVGLV